MQPKKVSKPGKGKKEPQAEPPIIPGQVPIGSVILFGGLKDEDWLARQGWMICDGRALDMDNYNDLYRALRGTFGQTGDLFNIPDCRGMFVRGVDEGKGKDPDASTRVAQAPGGNSGDKAGSVQGDMFRSHTHTISVNVSGNPDGWDDYGRNYWSNTWDSSNPSTQASGGNETRPVNVYMYYIIKFKNVV